MTKISIVIPCYNEAKTIKEIIYKIIKFQDYEKEIIVIDDGSSDETKLILKNDLINSINILILNEKNYGKGYSVKKGIQAATGDIILIQDADLEYDPSDYNKIIKPIINGDADVVYGSRFVGSAEKRVLNYWHKVINNFLTTLSNMCTNINLTDMEVGYKAFKSKVIKQIDLKENRFGFEPEITAKVAKKKLRIYEVGVKYFGRDYQQGKKIGWRDGFSALRCIIKYNFFN
jgi:glycosyltransferase involved in cell wall biosynthesis